MLETIKSLSLRWQDIIDIMIVAYIIYRVILLIKGTRAVQMLAGIAILIVLYFGAREFELLDHLKDAGPMLYDLELSVSLAPKGKDASEIATTNYNEMYYSAAQQLAHHTTSGCPMRIGDLLGSGTISGPEKTNRGSLLELSWGGKEPFALETGETRSFIEDGDTLTLIGNARGDGYTIGFGGCVGTVLPALSDPYARH